MSREKFLLACRRADLKKKYGLKVEEYEALAEKQNWVCAICGKPPGKRPLCVEHDHKTGKVRGLTCNKCNSILGMCDDDPDILRRAIEYLEVSQLELTVGSL